MTDIRQATPLSVPETDELRFLPEGPCALADGVFSWVGIQHGVTATSGSVNIYDLNSKTNRSFNLPGRPGFAFPCVSDNGLPTRFVVGCERSLGIFDTSDGVWTPFCEGIDADVENTIINDGMIVGDDLIFGTKDLEFATRKAGLYLWRRRDEKLIRLRDDQICSNGKAIRTASDGSTQLIDIDSPTRQIVSYPIDTDNAILGDAEVVIDLTDDPAVPDGAILTPDGAGVIVSMFLPGVADYGQTRLYDIASGELKIVWQTAGSPQNTCPALVQQGDKLKLIITTAVENMDAAAQSACPNAGKLFAADVDFPNPNDKPLSQFWNEA